MMMSPQVQEAHLIDVHVGQQVRQRRTLARISQTMIGERLGVSFQQVQKYENGANRISAGRLYQLGDLLNVSVSVFFDGLDTKRSAAAATDDELAAILEFATSPEGLGLCRAYLAAPTPAARKLAIDVLRLGAERASSSGERVDAG